MVTVASTFVGKMPLRKAHVYVKAQKGRDEIDQPQSIFLYNKGMGGVDRLNQNNSSYIIGHCSRLIIRVDIRKKIELNLILTYPELFIICHHHFF